MDQVVETQGIRIPKLGLGTWRLAGQQARDAVAGAIGMGYRHIDTARMYDNEEAVGQGIADAGLPRGELHVTSKVWHSDLAPGALRRALETSLRLLRLDHLDLYLIHWPSPDMDLPAALRALTRAREEGLVRAIGVSNFTVALMRQAIEAGAPIACNQVEYHVGLGQRPVLEFARAHGIAVTAYSPIGRGRFEDDPVIGGIARKHDTSVAAVLLAWLLEQDGVVAIPKAARPENQRANLAALDVRLDDEDRAAIGRMPKDRRFVNAAWAPAWDPPLG